MSTNNKMNNDDESRKKIQKRQHEVIDLIKRRQSEIEELHTIIQNLVVRVDELYLDNQVFGADSSLILKSENLGGQDSIQVNLTEYNRRVEEYEKLHDKSSNVPPSLFTEILRNMPIISDKDDKILSYHKVLNSLLIINEDNFEVLDMLSGHFLDISMDIISKETARKTVNNFLRKARVNLVAGRDNVDEISLFVLEYILNEYFVQEQTRHNFKREEFENTFAQLRQSLGRDKNNKVFHRALFKELYKKLLEFDNDTSNLSYVTEGLARNFLATLAHLERINISMKEVVPKMLEIMGEEGVK